MTKRARGGFAGWIAGIGTVLVLGGCNTPLTFSEVEETQGAAVRHNIAVQTVDPDPQNKLAPPAHDGARAAKSIERYRADEVKQPAEIRTSDVGDD